MGIEVLVSLRQEWPLFWNSDHQPIKGIVFELFEKLCEKVPLAGDLRIDHRIGDL